MPTHSFSAIPDELRQYKQWVLWRFKDVGSKKLSKIPYAINGTQASVTNPNDWCSFDDACHIHSFGNYDGIGFVFTEFDPLAFIDLDDTEGNQEDLQRQIKILKEFDSYAEKSPSGSGLHIIVKGNIPQGRRRSHVEIYSSGRYATMTGNVYENKPIAERHDLLNQLYTQMGAPPKSYNGYDGKDPQTEDDGAIIEIASNATNGAKFMSLHNGEWQHLYPTQSEADLAYIDIIAFYTQNAIQIERIFRNSKLMRKKVNENKGYLPNAIKKSFDRLLPKIDFDGFRIALEEKLAEQQQQLSLPLDNGVSSNGKTTDFDSDNAVSITATLANTSVAQRLEPSPHKRSDTGSNPVTGTILPPPGLVGEIAQFLYQAAPRPVPEIAIAGAMGFMAGICGRAYNISGTGLNQYILLLAPTGTGKEAMASGIDKIINEVQLSVPVASEFIGPSEIASGQALVKYLANKSQCFVSILGEFGLRLRSMSSEKANGAEIALRRMLLDLYNKSGHGQVARPSIYADVEKNTNLISAPAFSILGESTPDRFYDILTEEMISEGLLPRFMLIEYNGARPALNENSISIKPPDWLIQKIGTLMANAKTIMADRRIVNVEQSKDAEKLLKELDKFADSQINSTEREVTRQLWNRAHIKCLKISALIAVGVNPFDPVVEVEHVLWAKNVVESDIEHLSAKFESGAIGKNSDEVKQISDMKRMIKLFVTSSYDKVKSNCKDERLHTAKIIPKSFLSSRLYSMASYKNDKQRAALAVERTLKYLLDADLIRQCPQKEMIEKFGTSAVAYVVSNVAVLMSDG